MARKFQNIAFSYAIPSYFHNIESTLHICVHVYYITILDKTLSHLLDATKPELIINHQVNIEQERGSSIPTTSDASWLFDILDLTGIQDWPPDLQKQAKELFTKHQALFSKDDMDLGRTNLVKHKIVLTDPEPFKEKFRSIPPQLYSEVRNHLNEMLKLGAIRKSCSPWASAIVLVRERRMES